MVNGTTYNTDVIVLSTTSCILSIIGGTVIFGTSVVIPEIRNFTRKLVICLTIADVLTASGYLISAIKIFIEKQLDTDVCQIQSTITTYSSLVSFFFTSIIAIYLFDTVTHERCRLGTNNWMVFFNVLSWGIPAILIGIGWSRQVFGEDTTTTGGTGPWCWIKVDNTTQKSAKFWMITTGKGWEIACYLITTILYVFLKVRLWLYYNKIKFHNIHVSLREEDENFLLVWLLLYLIRFWGTARFMAYAISHPPELALYMKILLRFQAVGDPAQAFCNFILFCVCDRTVRKRLCSFRRTCPQNDTLKNALIKENSLSSSLNDTSACTTADG